MIEPDETPYRYPLPGTYASPPISDEETAWPEVLKNPGFLAKLTYAELSKRRALAAKQAQKYREIGIAMEDELDRVMRIKRSYNTAVDALDAEMLSRVPSEEEVSDLAATLTEDLVERMLDYVAPKEDA